MIETEVYSPDFDQWTIVAPLTMGQSEAGACLVNDRIFIVGGYCWSARRCIKVIQVKTVHQADSSNFVDIRLGERHMGARRKPSSWPCWSSTLHSYTSSSSHPISNIILHNLLLRTFSSQKSPITICKNSPHFTEMKTNTKRIKLH